MELKEKLNMLEDVLELEPNTLSLTDELANIEEYDSMSKLSIIVMMDEEFDKKLTGEKIREFITVGDIIDFMS